MVGMVMGLFLECYGGTEQENQNQAGCDGGFLEEVSPKLDLFFFFFFFL